MKTEIFCFFDVFRGYDVKTLDKNGSSLSTCFMAFNLLLSFARIYNSIEERGKGDHYLVINEKYNYDFHT